MPSPASWASALADPAASTPTPDQRRRRQQSLAQMVMQQAGDTQTPVYGKGHGVAKLVAGALGGLVEGLDAKQQQDRLDAALKAGNDAVAGMFGAGGGAPAAAPAGSASSGYNPSGKMPSFASMPIAQGLKPQETALLNAIAAPESGGRYDVRYSPGGGKTFADFSQHPGVFEAGPAGPSSAAGRYQFTKTTWNALGGGDFSPENQDRRALQLARQDYGRRTGRDLDADLATNGFTPQIASALAPTWAGFKDNPGKAMSAYRDTLGRTGQQAQADMPVAGGQPVEFNGGQLGFLIPGTDAVVPPAADPGKMAALGQITGGNQPAPQPAPVDRQGFAVPADPGMSQLSQAPVDGPMAGAPSPAGDVPPAPIPGGSPTVGDAVRNAMLMVGQDDGTDPAGTPGLLSPSFAPTGGESVNGLPSNSFGGPVFTPQTGTAVPLPPARPDAFGAVPSDMAMAAVPPLPPGRPAGLGVDPRADMPAPGAQQVMLPGNLPPGAGLAQLPGAPMIVSNPLPAGLFGGSDPATTGSVTPDNRRLAEILRRSDPMNSTDAGAGAFARGGMGNGPQTLGAAVANYQPGQAPATPAADPRRLAALVDPQGAAARSQAAQNAPQAASVGAPSVLPPNVMGGPAPGPNGPVTAQAGVVGGAPINMAQINALGNSPNPVHQMLAKGLVQRLTEGRRTSVVGGALVDTDTGIPIYQAPRDGFTLNQGDRRFGPDGRLIAEGGPKDDRTTEQRDYGFYSQQEQAAGRQPADFTTWMRENKRSGAQTITVDQKSENAEAQGRGAGIAKRMNDLADDGTKAGSDAQLYGRFADLLGSVKTGRMTASLEKIRQATGLALDPNTDQVQALNALIQHVAPSLRVPGSGAQSDRELGNFLQSIPSLAGTPGGNKQILDTLNGVVEYRRQRSQIATQCGAIASVHGRNQQNVLHVLVAGITEDRHTRLRSDYDPRARLEPSPNLQKEGTCRDDGGVDGCPGLCVHGRAPTAPPQSSRGLPTR